jgi:transcriptional regulator with XRE-family HTH domain
MRYSTDPFSTSLSRLIKESGLSLRALKANRELPFHFTYIGKLAKGKRPAPDVKIIEMIAKALGVEPDYFKEYRLNKINEVLRKDSELEINIYESLK